MNNIKDRKRVVGVWVTAKLYEKLGRLAKEEGRSLSSYVARLLEAHVEARRRRAA